MSFFAFSDGLARFRRSAASLRSVRVLTATGMLGAAQIVLGLMDIQVLPSMRFSFGYLAASITGMLFGPAVAGLQCALVDVIKAFTMSKGAFFPGYTLSALVGGLIYGFVLYERPHTWQRVLLARGLVNLIANVVLNTLWIMITQGSAMSAVIGPRILKNALFLPVEVALILAVSVAIARAQRFLPQGKRSK